MLMQAVQRGAEGVRLKTDTAVPAVTNKVPKARFVARRWGHLSPLTTRVAGPV